MRWTVKDSSNNLMRNTDRNDNEQPTKNTVYGTNDVKMSEKKQTGDSLRRNTVPEKKPQKSRAVNDETAKNNVLGNRRDSLRQLPRRKGSHLKKVEDDVDDDLDLKTRRREPSHLGMHTVHHLETVE